MPVMSARGTAPPPSGRGQRVMLAEALDRPGEPLAQRHPRLEAHPLARAGRVEEARGVAVRSRAVPDDLALVADELADGLGQVADARLDARADVDRLRAVEVLGGEQERAGRVVDVEELARRPAGAPQAHRLVAALA